VAFAAVAAVAFSAGTASAADRNLIVSVTGQVARAFSANSDYYSGGYEPYRAADGSHDGGTGTGFAWAQTGCASNGWWQVTWNDPMVIHRVVLYDRVEGGDHFANDVRLTFSDGTYIDATGLSNLTSVPLTVDFASKQTYSLRVTALPGGQSADCGLAEVEAYGIPLAEATPAPSATPTPAPSATPTPGASSSPTASPTPTVAPTVAPTATPSQGPIVVSSFTGGARDDIRLITYTLVLGSGVVVALVAFGAVSVAVRR
jgi:hypothetical protein